MHIHILGICGTFMGGLAALARQAGHKVTGCDAGVYPPMSDQLRALGIDLIEGYGEDQLSLHPDVWVIGNVVSRVHTQPNTPKFPLMEAILERGLVYTSGPQWLSEHILHTAHQPNHVLAVAGTHGKTTTTAMLTWILESAGYEPGFLIGGVPLNFGVSARLAGQRKGGVADRLPPFVIEADEYDTAFFDKRSKFVHYKPRTAILNNLEFDHADIFENLAAIERQFHHLVRTVPRSGQVVVNANEASLARVLQMGVWSGVSYFGNTQQANWQARGEPSSFDILLNNEVVSHIDWSLSGVHNQMNALSSIAAAHHYGVSPAQAAQALQSFVNVKRRMEIKGVIGAGPSHSQAITVYDDFAHHPTAIQTTLEGLRKHIGPGPRILAVFEARSNTMKLGSMNALLPSSLSSADLSLCHSQGLEWDAASVLAPLGAKAMVCQNLEELANTVCAQARQGDHILCMSNGSFGGIHDKILRGLEQKFSG
jgi:UDP-N-acetylmuramate: L-alanyl-gamma-D-glutamyl-meso-diaminopimelate ligase